MTSKEIHCKKFVAILGALGPISHLRGYSAILVPYECERVKISAFETINTTYISKEFPR